MKIQLLMTKEEHGERKEIDELTTNVDQVDLQNGS